MTESTPSVLGPTTGSEATGTGSTPGTAAGAPVPAPVSWPPAASTFAGAAAAAEATAATAIPATTPDTAQTTDPAAPSTVPATQDPVPLDQAATATPESPPAATSPADVATSTAPPPAAVTTAPDATNPAPPVVSPADAPKAPASSGRRKVVVLVVIGVAVLLLLAAAAFAYLHFFRSDDTDPVAGGLPTSQALGATQLIVSSDADGNRDLYLEDAATGKTVGRLTSSPTPDTSPLISPDRRTIVYIHHTSDKAATDKPTLRVAGAADGSGDRALFATSPEVCARNIARPAWNPADPSVLAIPCTGASGAWHLYLIRTDGTVVGEVAGAGQAGKVSDPTFSPDGKQLVFVADIDATHDGGNLVVASGDGATIVRKLTSTGRPGADSDPAWSPDGSQVAFRRRAAGNSDVWVVGADGKGLRRLTKSPAAEQDPSWSPDGSLIAYKSNVGSKTSRTWVMTAKNGGNRHPLGLTGVQLAAPSWTRR
jgi:Tol biopolymer transport system component